jgi:hypothetical protein
MIRLLSLGICLLVGLMLSAGCAPLPETHLTPGTPDQARACISVFPAGPWESVHGIEADIGRGPSSSLLGITRGDPSGRILHSLLLTPEGFILFEAEFRDGGISVLKAVAPFDRPDFAGGLMEDVNFLFLPPQVHPSKWGTKADGAILCRWRAKDGSETELVASADRTSKILRRDSHGETTKEAHIRGPFVNGLASQIELRVYKPTPYRLTMTLLRPTS